MSASFKYIPASYNVEGRVALMLISIDGHDHLANGMSAACRACTLHLLALTLVVLLLAVPGITQQHVLSGTWGYNPGGQRLDVL